MGISCEISHKYMEQAEKEIINNFKHAMYDKIQLRHGRYSPMGWKSMDIKRLIWLLEGELAELKEAYNSNDTGNALKDGAYRNIRKGSIQDEAVDIANYAMFIYELSK